MNDTIPFRDGVDFALDLAASIGGKVTSMMVSDNVINLGAPKVPGVVDLHVTIVKRCELPLNHIRLNFEAFRTIEPCLPANPTDQPPRPSPTETT